MEIYNMCLNIPQNYGIDTDNKRDILGIMK